METRNPSHWQREKANSVPGKGLYLWEKAMLVWEMQNDTVINSHDFMFKILSLENSTSNSVSLPFFFFFSKKATFPATISVYWYLSHCHKTNFSTYSSFIFMSKHFIVSVPGSSLVEIQITSVDDSAAAKWRIFSHSSPQRQCNKQ